MDKQIINDENAEQIVGGSIVFNGAHTTCGRNRNDQYKVLDYAAVIKYIAEHRHSMSEKTMLNNMLSAGLLENL